MRDDNEGEYDKEQNGMQEVVRKNISRIMRDIQGKAGKDESKNEERKKSGGRGENNERKIMREK